MKVKAISGRNVIIQHGLLVLFGFLLIKDLVNQNMLNRLIKSFQILLKHRLVVAILAVFLVESLAVFVYLVLSIQPTELQVVVHYTAYGPTNFYRDKWTYLISFVAFVSIIVPLFTLLIYRILVVKGEQLAAASAWLGVIVMAVAAATFYQVLKIASLS